MHLVGLINHERLFSSVLSHVNQLQRFAFRYSMDEILTPVLENAPGEIICITEKFALLETLEQMGDVTTSGSQAESPETQFREHSSSADRSADGFQFEKKDCPDEVEMDGDLWGELSEHLIENIFAKLPVLCFLRLRSVCKKWNALISNPLFLENCSRAEATGSSSPPLFLLYADHARQSYPSYDPSSNAWYLLPQTLNSSPSDKSSTSSLVVLAAAGGLLCLADTLSGSEEEDLSLYVSNPFTKSRRRLPPMIPMPNRYVVGMVVDNVKKTYKILVARNGEHLKLQVYDSASDSWQMTGSVSKRLALLVGTACTQGTLYCLAFGTGLSVSAYHAEKGVWVDLRAPMPAYLAWPQVFVSRGQLMLVGAISLWGVTKSVCVWQLDPLQMEWVEVLRVPDDLMARFSRGPHQGAHYLFVADADYICISRYRVKQMLMCNVFKKSWWWMPLCPFETGEDAPNLSGFPLQPSLVASV